MAVRRHAITTLALSAVLSLASAVYAQDAAPTSAPVSPAARAEKLISTGLAFLKSQQADDGSFSKDRGGLAISALALKALAQSPEYHDQAFVKKGFTYLLGNQLESGGIYKDSLASYNTAIAISALAKANNPDYKPAIDKAVAFLKSLQWTENMEGLPKGEKIGPGDARIGGWGYGSKGRPDGSNTSMAVDALKEAGLSESDEAFKKAAEFMSRTQNFSTNDQPFAKGLKNGGDGGFIYSPANGGESFAKDYTDESGTKRFHSYGSMTYAGLKSLLYAGISKDDPRVIAAYRWLCSSFSTTENPGMVNAGKDHAADGLFYYYHVMARSLNAYGQPSLPTTAGDKDWRLELLSALEKSQQPNGSWTGGKAYMETNPTLVTSYSVLALQEVLDDLKRNPPK
jgi:squalene-hopene/tetraprenyl-beta-curcumene cyclase